jgi:hypothetical protein
MDAQNFWLTFASEACRLASQFRAGESREVFEVVETMLTRYGFNYCFDITATDETCLLILSPEGDSATATRIDALIALAPQLRDWQVVGRRQKKPINDVRAIVKNLYLIDLFQCRFRVSSYKINRNIEIFVPTSTDLTPAEQEGLAATFLWHALGEAQVMEAGTRATVQIGIPDDVQTVSAGELVS